MNIFYRLHEEQGLPITHQKVVIFEVVSQQKNHPTPEEIYQEVVKRLPSISKATVYANIKRFCELGLVRIIETAGVKRVDPNIQDHHHVISKKTGKITDVYIDEDIPLPKGIKPEDVTKIVINYYTK